MNTLVEKADNTRKMIVLWLLTGCLLIFLMVVIGGITRLTGSGLSITEWNVIMGTIPPMSQHDWQIAFEKYQNSPQFQKVNFDMGLEEFKSIFLWEYIHRLLGRLIGAVFLIPFLYFLLTKKLDRTLFRKLLLLFALGGLQGFLGWFMVKSGLVNDPHVSHYRLAIHLITAFILFGVSFWIALDLMYPAPGGSHSLSPLIRKLTKAIMVLVVLQVIYGALVAGLHAGRIYNTFPKMGNEWMAEAVTTSSPFWKNLTENLAGVQFIHRCIAWLIVLLALILWLVVERGKLLCWIVYVLFSNVWLVEGKHSLTSAQRKGVNTLLIILAIQFGLGIITLLYAAPITLAVLHQAGAFALFAAIVFLSHSLKGNSYLNFSRTALTSSTEKEPPAFPKLL